MKKLVNAKTFIIPCMRAGLCQYQNERILVPQSALEKLSKTSYGIPLILPEHVEQAELEKNLDKYLAGRVADMHYNTDDDLWYAHCVADTQEAIDLFAKGWGVSTSYEVLKKGKGGTLNAVDYDSTMEDGRYLHLAIVEHPRYEMAIDPVFYNSADKTAALTQEKATSTIDNSTSYKGVKSMLFFRSKKEDVKDNSADMMIEVGNGNAVTLEVLVNSYQNAKKNEEDMKRLNSEVEALKKEKEEMTKKNEEKEDKEKEIEIELKNKNKKNDDDSDMNNSDDDSEGKEEKEKEKEKEKEIKNKKNERFNSLKETVNTVNSVLDNSVDEFKTLSERAELGKKRYGNK